MASVILLVAVTTSSLLPSLRVSGRARCSVPCCATAWDPQSSGDVALASLLGLCPLDADNAALLDAVHPRSWQDPTPPDVYDLVVIGAGAGGLVSAKQAARRGARSCLISEELAGGDCLNVGCVPSKALLRSARAAREVRRAADFGVVLSEPPSVDFAAVMARLRRLRAKIAPADAHSATVSVGADVYQGRGRFVRRDAVEVNGQLLTFKKAVIATGGRAAVPPIPGLESTPYLTNSNLFNLRELPPRLVIVGAGPIGLEMAQAFATFGSRVHVLGRSASLLPQEHPAAGRALAAALEEDGVVIVYNTTVQSVAHVPAAGGVLEGQTEPATFPTITVQCVGRDAQPFVLECDALLIATGRSPNVADLGLEMAGVAIDAGGVLVDERLQTSNPNVYAVGDCVSGTPRFTHVAGEHAKVAVENALFGGEWRHTAFLVPGCIYTEPEVATVGLSSALAAAAAGVDVDEYFTSLEGNDRAILEDEDEHGGFVNVLCRQGTAEIVGATVCANRAGEIINELTLAIQAKVGLDTLARVIHPYPTTSEAVMQCALQWIRARWKTM